MPGITLSSDEIKAAPPEVRRWVEQAVARMFAGQPSPAAVAPPALVGCTIEEARGILSLVQAMLPVVSVFFELGREAASVSVHGMRAFLIAEMQRHARLQAPQQVVQCLDLLTQALRQVRGDANAAFCAMDNQGHCLVAETTMRSILRLWQEIVAQRALEPMAADAPDVPEAPVPAEAAA
ncbi:MAG: hypothetical protein WDN25_06215 [Acetobacteraceae bacterium]